MQIFQVQIKFPPDINPPYTKMKFEDRLRRYFERKKIKFIMPDLGGMQWTFGLASRRTNMTETDRVELARWIKQQKIHVQVGIGDLEPADAFDSNRIITEWVFTVKNHRQRPKMHKR